MSVRLNPSGNKRGMGYFAATPAEKHLWKQVFLVVFDAGWLAKEARDMFRVGEEDLNFKLELMPLRPTARGQHPDSAWFFNFRCAKVTSRECNNWLKKIRALLQHFL